MGLPKRFGLVIIGGGPGGLAPLLAAHRRAGLDALLSQGVAIIEQAPHLGGGNIGNYLINSDSSGATFVDCLNSIEPSALTALSAHPLTQRLAAAGDGAVRLRDVGAFLDLVGQTLGGMIAAHPACQVLTRHFAVSATRIPTGWRVVARNADGKDQVIIARNVVLATGAYQPMARLADECIGGVALHRYGGDRLLQSGLVLSQGGLDHVARMLDGIVQPHVAIIGGSTSAAAVAHAMLNRLPSVRFGAGGITLLHRRPLHIYYPDTASALAEGYTEFGDQDICPVSGKVFRFAGFRLDSRELIMQARGLGGRPAEPRLRLHHLADTDPRASAILDQAHLIVAALGYRPNALPLLDQANEPIELLAHTGAQKPLVDGMCRVLDGEGAPLPGVFGIGLAAGFQPRGHLGGEPSFRGQANGLWLWQNDVGAIIADAILASAQPAWADDDARFAPAPAPAPAEAADLVAVGEG